MKKKIIEAKFAFENALDHKFSKTEAYNAAATIKVT